MTERFTRRRMLQMVGAATAACPLRMVAEPIPLLAQRPMAERWEHGTRLVATVRADATAQAAGIAAFERQEGTWQQRQFVPAPRARQVLTDRSGTRLFVTHEAGATGYPAGAVEVFRIEGDVGTLARDGRQHLALASLAPLALTLSPDERMLVVASEGGVLSMLPIEANGSLGAVIAAHKNLALSTHLTNGAELCFHDASQLRLHTRDHSFHYECSKKGFALAESTERRAASNPSSVADLPFGVQSYVVLPLRNQ